MACAIVRSAPPASAAEAEAPDPWASARARGAIYADCGRNARRLLQGWLDLKRDPQTHLYSRGRAWDYHNEAADHYSSLVLIAFCTQPDLNEPGGALHQTLASAQKLCATPSGIPTTYDLRTHKKGKPASLAALSEWLRDGLIRICELLGTDNDWYRELVRLTDAMLAEADRRGGPRKAFAGHEPAGHMLQTLARLHAMSGDAKYIEAAEAIADPYLLESDAWIAKVRFRDHGCEVVPGLAELFALECQLKRPKATAYREPMRKLLDRILKTAAHPETGLFRRGNAQPPDTWGYVLFGYENADRGTGEARYRDAILKPLRWLAAHRTRHAELKTTLWPDSRSSDNWSDSYESFIVLWSRYRDVPDAFAWLDWATRQHIHRRHPDRPYGPYTGGHFDGSTGRTLSIHRMLCSQGVRALPFAEGLRLGAIERDGVLFLTVESDAAWDGKLLFDGPRAEHKAATLDWARINEMPQWFVARPDRSYAVTLDDAEPKTLAGSALLRGLRLRVETGATRRIHIRPLP